MIRTLRGTLEAVGPDWAVIGVGGVGFQVFVPLPALASLGPVDSPVSLHTHLAVREESLTLYGFPTQGGLRLFELLLTISGIGPRLALAVLGGLTPEALATAIAAEDEGALSAVSGVGKRTAARIIMELKGKMEEEWPMAAMEGSGDRGDVTAALLALGYSASEARRAVAALPQDPKLSVEELVREALRLLSPG